MCYFLFKSVFIPEQHGFRFGNSTTTNLCVVMTTLPLPTPVSIQVDCVYLDFAMARTRPCSPNRKAEGI